MMSRQETIITTREIFVYQKAVTKVIIATFCYFLIAKVLNEIFYFSNYIIEPFGQQETWLHAKQIKYCELKLKKGTEKVIAIMKGIAHIRIDKTPLQKGSEINGNGSTKSWIFPKKK